MPERIQLRRTKGWRKPEGAIVVSRPSKWGNVFKVGDPSPWGEHEPMTRAAAVEAYRYLISSAGTILWGSDVFGWEANPEIVTAAREELRGHDLACWCPLDQPCHADVLLEIANSPDGVLTPSTNEDR